MRAALVLLFLILNGSSASASWKTSGSLEAYGRQYFFASKPGVSNQSSGLNLNLKADWKSQSLWRFRSDLEAVTDLSSQDAAEKFQGNPRSLYLENKASPVTVRLGYQTLVFEGPDLLNPADLIHSKNWILPASPRTLSSAGLSLSHEMNEWQWDFFWIPEQTRPKWPGEHSAWWPREKRLPIESEETEFRLPEETRYEFAEEIELNQALKNNFAFRLQRKSENFEGQLVLHEGLSTDPFLLVDVTATLLSLSPKQILLVDSPVRLKPVYYRRQAAAFTFLLPLQTWVIKGGANWLKPLGADHRLPSESSTGVLGIEKNMETRLGMVTFILQHEEQKKLDKDQMSFLRSLFQNSWSAGLRVPWGEETQFLGGLVYDTLGKSSVYRFSADRRLTDQWSVRLDGTWLEGPDETLVGLYNSYDHWSLQLRAFF